MRPTAGAGAAQRVRRQDHDLPAPGRIGAGAIAGRYLPADRASPAGWTAARRCRAAIFRSTGFEALVDELPRAIPSSTPVLRRLRAPTARWRGNLGEAKTPADLGRSSAPG